MENKLISMVEFCFKQNIVSPKEMESLLGTDWRKEFEVKFKRNVNYTNFLSQPLQKWMFDKYDERCLFINVRLIKRQKHHVVTLLNYDHIWLNNDDSKTIEDLVKYNLTLTATALKEIEG